MAKKPENTTSIVLNVPNDLYDSVSDKARVESRKEKKKKTIHDKMVETLEKGDKS